MIESAGVGAIWDVLPEARIVGGAVRDRLLARAVADVDFATPLSPDRVIARLRDAGIKVVASGLSHGTVTAVIEGLGFEITTLRRDVATDGRHAVVAYTEDWREDASRRDFTINAMSAARDGKVFDYFGGREDLAAGLVRFVGQPDKRISEDFLRILRFFRFFARYGRGEADAEALAAISARRDGLRGLSAERVWAELKKILAAEDPLQALAGMARTGVLALLLPGAEVAGVQALAARGAPAAPLLRLAALTREPAERLAARLRLSGEEAECLGLWRAPLGLDPAADDGQLMRALAEDDAGVLVARSWLVQDDGPGWDSLRARLAGMARPQFPLQGRDLLALNVPAGPAVGGILAELRAWWIAGGCVADGAACLAQARRLLPAAAPGDDRRKSDRDTDA
jgi:poly(A) polymerase/tRNA nucleotidyltransferase (CCA-adding enzyme)